MASNSSMSELERVESEWFSNPSPVLCARLADLLRQAGKYDESRKTATEGLKKWKNNTSISVVLGKCYIDSGLLEKALEVFEGVHASFPQNLVALRSLAEIHYKKEHWNKAVDFFEEYIFENPADDEARKLLREAKDRKDQPSMTSSDDKEEAEVSDDAFPQTERMQKVLESQGIGSEGTDGLADEDDPVPEAAVELTSPGSLLEFFSDKEKEELKLKAYDSED